MRTLRLISLAWRMLWRSKAKFAMLVALVTSCVLVFLVVQEFSRASTESLDGSLTTELGTTGSYKIDIDPSLNLTLSQMLPLLKESLASMAIEPIIIIDTVGPIDVGCGTSGTEESAELFVLRDENGTPSRFDPSSGLEPGAICIGGLDISTATRATSKAELHSVGEGFVVDSSTESQAFLAAGGKLSESFILITGQSKDMTSDLIDLVTARLQLPAAANAAQVQGSVQVERLDAATDVKRAANGVRLVYGVVAWAILFVGGLGILLTEIATVRERNWLYGLARAVGASRVNIAFLVFLDVAFVMAASAIVSLTSATALAPSLNSFGLSTFDVGLNLLRPDIVPQLGIALLALLLIGSAIPAKRAALLDPAEILEQR